MSSPVVAWMMRICDGRDTPYAHARAKASLLMRSLMLILVLGIVILSTVTGRAKRGLLWEASSALL